MLHICCSNLKFVAFEWASGRNVRAAQFSRLYEKAKNTLFLLVFSTWWTVNRQRSVKSNLDRRFSLLRSSRPSGRQISEGREKSSVTQPMIQSTNHHHLPSLVQSIFCCHSQKHLVFHTPYCVPVLWEMLDRGGCSSAGQQMVSKHCPEKQSGDQCWRARIQFLSHPLLRSPTHLSAVNDFLKILILNCWSTINRGIFACLPSHLPLNPHCLVAKWFCIAMWVF